MANLTATKVRALVKNGLPGRHSDGNGLYLMLPKRGEPYWMLRYTLAGKRRELTLAKFVELSLAEARERAVEAQKEIRSGIDPIEERKREGRITLRTVSDLFEDWYLDLEKRLKHPRIPKRIFLREVSPSIGGIPIGDVTPMDVRAIIKKVAGSDRPTIANDTLMYLKQLFNHAIKLGLIKYNPASAFTVTDAGGVEKSRERALTVEEIQHVFKVFRENSDSFTRENYLACAMLLILGVRKTELTEAKWSEFDLKNECWTLPAERSKSGVEIVIPLPPNTVKWLDELKIHACGSDYVFPNRRSSKHPHMGKDTLNRAISKLFGKEPGRKQQPENKMGDIAEFTVHDLRRTCRSLMASAGVPGHVAERCLNHKLKGVEGIYDRYDYFDERREALAKVEGLVLSSVKDG